MSSVFSSVATVRDYVDLPTCLLVMSTCLLIYLYVRRRPRNLPPGPRALPIVGNSYLFAGAEFVPAKLAKLSEEYGDVMSLWGVNHFVVISGYATIREALVRKAEHFSSRKKDPFYSGIRGDGKNHLGVLFAASGPVWKQQRRFALMTLRDFGVGRLSMEAKIAGETEVLIREVANKDGQAFDISDLMQITVANIICSITFGKSFDFDDPAILHLLDMLNGMAHSNPRKDFLPAFHSAFRYVPFAAPEHRKVEYYIRQVQLFCQEQIADHKASFDPTNIRDFIDAFLLEQTRADPSGGFTDQQLREVVVDLFAAGTETSATTLRWALLHMVLNPDIQEKVHREIDDVLGQAVPVFALRDKMPYIAATLAEVQRMNTVAPLGVPHATSTDTALNGYSIPADTLIITNLWSVHMDPELFPEPHKFNPDRFLDQDGNFVKHEALIPFSVGPRVCMGEQLARMEVFLLFVFMMQRFTFNLPEDAPTPSLTGDMGSLINSPRSFELCAVPRG